jgi:hypothetical protein
MERLLILLAVLISLVSCMDSKISKVKNYVFEYNRAITFNDVLELYQYSKSIEWREGTEKKIPYVLLTVKIDLKKIPTHMVKKYEKFFKEIKGVDFNLIFVINLDNTVEKRGQFVTIYETAGGVIQKSTIFDLLKLIYSGDLESFISKYYEYTHPIK